MLVYENEIHFEDDEKERARRVEIYMKQVEMLDLQDPEGAEVFRQGPYAKPVFCVELNRKFPSIRSAANHIGTKRSYLKTAIRKNGGRYGGFTFQIVDEAPNRVRTGRERPVRCVSDGITFESLTEAKAYGNVASSTLCEALKNANGSDAICGGKTWRYVDSNQRLGNQLVFVGWDGAFSQPGSRPRTTTGRKRRIDWSNDPSQLYLYN